MGPLEGLKVIEVVGLGPAPFAAMVLADMGAEVIRVQRPRSVHGRADPRDFLARGKRSIALDLKRAAGAGALLRLVEGCDVLIEGFRPGVMERLGLGPDACLERNPKLIYGRMTGWGQSGPRAAEVGHDIDYIALTGALHAVGRAGERPVPPLNLVGDFGGGGLLLAFGILCALRQVDAGGEGQVVDAAMVDGASLLMTMAYSMRAAGLHSDARGHNLLDTGAPFYEVYETSDGKYLAVGALEPPFYAALLKGLGLEGEALPAQMDTRSWPAMKERFAEVFKQKTRAQWCTIFEGSDACVAPVRSMQEAPHDPHLRERGTFVEIEGFSQPAPAPRFSRSPTAAPTCPVPVGADTRDVLREAGLSAEEVERLREDGTVGCAD